MIKILFICHGNICRSPMSEFVLKDMVEQRGLTEQFEIREIYVFIIILLILNAIITLRNKLQSDELHRGSFLL